MKPFLTILRSCILLSCAFGDDLPFELKRLNEQRDRKIAEINRIYKQQLEELKTKYTKEGNLDAANQVVSILDQLDPAAEPEEETRWEWGSGGELVLRPNGVATHTIWKRNGKWRRGDDGLIRLESDSGKAFTIRIEGDLGHVLGLRDGKRTIIKRKE